MSATVSPPPPPPDASDPFEERPEAFVAGAFAGGLLLAVALRWIGRDRD